MNKKQCAISVDMDPIYHYLKARDYEPLKNTNLNAIYDDALPRFLDIFDQYDIKATFFIVGRDATDKANKIRIRDIYKRGHEIANHTYNHYQHFSQLGLDEKKDEIEKADKILSDTIGEKIYGFRAPGWGIDRTTLEILELLNYKYDSSIFPSLLISLISFINWLLNKGRLQKTLGSSINIGLSPKKPYQLNNEKIWKRGNSKIIELPTTVLPILQVPFLGTVLYMFGAFFFKICFKYFRLFQRSLLYELHGIELVDYYESINDERLLVKPGLGKIIQEKVDLYHLMLKNFNNNYKFITMKELAKEVK